MSDTTKLPPLLAQPEFMLGATRREQWPEDSGGEAAFAGRSNVGKSSAINCIMNRRKLARISKTPGRTQEINFFRLSQDARLVDLPGYGFAKVPISVRNQWEQSILDYLCNRPSLRGLILLMDARHPMTELDQQMLAWCDDNDLPAHILLTKSDKLSRNKAKQSLFSVEKILSGAEDLFSVQLFSSQDRTGLAAARDMLLAWLAPKQTDTP